MFKEKSKNGAGYELYSKRWLQYAKNGWKKENDLVLKIGFDSSGLYDIGQEKGYGAAQNMWMKGVSQSMFEARVWLMGISFSNIGSGISYVNASCTTMTQMTLDYLVPFGIIVG